MVLGFTAPYFLLIHQRIRDLYQVSNKESGMDTMGITSSGRILVNPDFVATLSKEELQGVMAHEMLHLVLMHHGRRGGRDAWMWNVSADMAINDALRHDGIKLPKNALYPPPEYNGDVFVEPIYEFLKKNPRHLPKSSGKAGPDGTPGTQGAAGAGCGVIDDDGDGDGPDWKQISVEVRAHAQSMGVGRGTSGVAALLSPRVARIDWKKIIRHGMEVTASRPTRDYQTFARRHRRSPAEGVQLPGWRGHQPSLAEIIDVSGSMDREWINQIVSETINLMKTFSGIRVFLAVHTSELVYAGWLTQHTQWKLNEAVSFSGGTDPQPAYDAVKDAKSGKWDTITHFTDCQFGQSWPEVPARQLVVGAFCRDIYTKPPDGSRIIYCEMPTRNTR
jgi:predicted metal-dependent peptidase